MKFKKLSLFNFLVLVGVIGLLVGCGEQKLSEEQVNTKQNKSSQIDNKLLKGQNKRLNGVKIPENNMYGKINVNGKNLTIPVARKKNWDYVMEKCDVKMCEVFGILGNEYISYCKQEVKKVGKKE